MEDNELFSPTLLDTEEKWGHLNALVVDEHEQGRPVVDPEHASKLFVDAGCPSAVFVFDWAARHATHACIRLTSVKVVAVLENDVPLGQCTGELEIGLPSIEVSPYLWFLYLAVRIKELSIVEIALFECICQALALMQSSREAQEETRLKN
jgi:hypothetical protein